MSLARAFTTRRVKQMGFFGDGDSLPQRSNTTKLTGNIPLRHKISAPVQLVHTTNMLSYNAPDIPKSAISTSSSTRSDEELSDGPSYTTASSPPTSPDVPTSQASSPEPNHLSCYFTAPMPKSASVEADAPAIPKRAPSHTKKASYEALMRSRSHSRLSDQSTRTVSSKASFNASRSSSSSTSTSVSSHNSLSATHQLAPKPSTSSFTATLPAATAPEVAAPNRKYNHPFGKELAQVSEIAEEYGVRERLNVVEAEEQELVAKGLFKFSADDYLGEIQSLFSTIFIGDVKTAPARSFTPPRVTVEAEEALWI